jgi:hypothetical protein
MGRTVGTILGGIILGLLIVWLVMSQVSPSAPQPDIIGIRRSQVAPPTGR